MSKFLKWSWWIVLVALVSCAQLVAPGATPSPTTSPLTSPLASPLAVPGSVVIMVHRTGGFAGVDETWTLYDDGRVAHTGRGTGQTNQIGSNAVAAVIAVARANFAALNTVYKPANTCCDRFVYEIAITVNGQTKTIHAVDGAADEPPTTTQVLTALQAVMK
jgi:hypothetical protein